jgi:hypothetical protein
VRSIQTNSQFERYIRERYFSRIVSRRRANKTATDITRIVQDFIEERNYLLFTLANKIPSELKEIMTWSVEGLYQFIYANNVDAKKAESRQKTFENELSAKQKKR